MPASDRHFRTSHLTIGLKKRSVRAGAITVTSQATKFILNIGSTAILARLLTPADFGLVAMVSALTGFVALFKDMGLTAATIQRAEIDHDEVSSLFWINVVLGTALAGICAVLAPAVAMLYGEPRLTAITIVVSSTLIIGGLASQHAALLLRQMRFGALCVIEVASLAAAIATAVAMAIAGFGYWSLVGMLVVQSIGMLIGTWLAVGWIPGIPRHPSRALPLLRFGGNLTGFNLLTYLVRNGDNVLIGSVLGATSLGIYAKAFNLLMLPIRQISYPMGAVAVPALSRLQDDPARYRRYCLRAIELMALFSLPTVAFAFVAADSLIMTVLGPQWSATILVFRLLAPAAFIGSMSVVPVWLCTSLGCTSRLLRWALVSAPATIVGFVIGLQWGASGVAASLSITSSVTFVALLTSACKGSPVSLRDVASQLWRPALNSAAAAAITYFFVPVITPSRGPLGACVDAVIFGVAFGLLSLSHSRGRRLFAEAATLVLSTVRRPSPRSTA